MPFEFQKLTIPDVILIKSRIFKDPRGFFLETYKQSEFEKNGIKTLFVQDNYSHSEQSVLRGIHFQKMPAVQAKLVRVLQGKLFDVAVDLRRESPFYGQWVGIELSGEEGAMLYIPEGFGHGFCVLSETVDFMYKVSRDYAPTYESGIRWDDSELGIHWPIKRPLLSEKDKQLPFFKNADDIGVRYK